jgi:hypothetical protein
LSRENPTWTQTPETSRPGGNPPAIRRGLIERQACWRGDPKAEAHYLDYRDPEKVVFLCNRHHRQRHQADRLHRALGLPILRQVLTELAQEAACAATALVKAQQPEAAAA